jgi:signal transduction histidine kinase/CheY-like chemotaxis protein
METGRPLRTASYHTDPRVQAPLHHIAAQTGTVALMVVPIVIGTDIAGLLYISNRSAREFTDEDEAVSVRLAEQAAIAIQNARLFAREGAARADAEAANRSKDAFLAMLSHELRNPLGAITTAVELLDRLDDDTVAERARAVIARQAEHLARLVDDLLDVSRATSGKITLRREVVDLGAITRDAVAALTARRAADAPDVAVDVGPVHVHGDPVRLEQVVSNLTENALKYTPTGGRIDVRLREEDGHAVLTVEDTGIGIAPDLLPHVFDLFVQADRSLDRAAGGLGIGLTLVRRIVELHRGSVEATSEGPGRGSRFTVRLPSTAEAPPVPAAPPAAPDVRLRVLVVEDNDDAREMLCHLVGVLGHEIHEAHDGAGAVEMILALRPDVTLIDIGLPGVDGYEVARRVRQAPKGADLHLVAVTGYGRGEDRERALAAGYDAHVVKPVDPARVAAVLAARASCGGRTPVKSSPDGGPP